MRTGKRRKSDALTSLGSTVIPGVSASTMNPERALDPFAVGSVLARTKSQLALPPFVIQHYMHVSALSFPSLGVEETDLGSVDNVVVSLLDGLGLNTSATNSLASVTPSNNALGAELTHRIRHRPH